MEDRFIQAILDDPDDDGVRLVCADYFEENGQPERAEFIRLQVEEARLPLTDPGKKVLQSRACQILRVHERAWLAPLRRAPLRRALDRPRCKQLLQRWFARGFLDAVNLEVRREDFLGGAGGELARHPIRTVILSADEDPGIDGALEDLAAAEGLDGVHLLFVGGQAVPSSGALGPLGSAPGLGRLERLAFDPRLPPSALTALEGTPLAARLQGLKTNLGFAGGAELLDLVGDAAPFPCLSSLYLTYWYGGVPDLGRLAHCRGLAGLRELTLRDHGHGNTPMQGLLDSPLWVNLEELALDGFALGPGGTTFPAAVGRSRLRRLRLRCCQYPPGFVAALAGAHSWGELRELSLQGVDLSAGEAAALFGCPHLASVTSLYLDGCGLGEGEVRALIASPHLAGLRELFVHDFDLTLGAKRALRRRFGDAFRFGWVPF